MNYDLDVLEHGNVRLDLLSRKLFVSGCEIVLRNKEFSLLKYFLSNMGRVVSRTQLLEDVWDQNIFCSTNTIDVHISNLRRKISKYSKATFIRTVHCIGYILDC